MDGKHEYRDGLCIHCGENYLAAMGWNRLRARNCSNKICGAILSATASTCPHCQQQQKKTFVAILTNFYFVLVEPVRIYLFSKRPSGINFFEQGLLLCVTALGVGFGFYARSVQNNDSLSIGYREVIASLFIAIVVIPALIKEKSFLDPRTPFINRIGLALQKGLASDVIVEGLGYGLT